MIDWGDGDYARTAAALAPAAAVTLARAGATAGQALLDVGCGTGNAALLAARQGAVVTAVDPAEGLVAIARDRLREAGVPAPVLVAPGEALPLDDDAFDVVVSVFAVIFSARPDEALADMLRVARPGGTVAITSWLPGGAIDEAGRLLRAVMAGNSPAAPGPDAPRWTEPAWIAERCTRHGATGIAQHREQLVFSAASPEAWFAEQEEHHPVWRAVRAQHEGARWDRLREDTITVLRDGNEDPSALRVTSDYLVTLAAA